MVTTEESTKYFMDIIKQENDGTTFDLKIPSYASKKFEGYMSMLQDLILCNKALEILPISKNVIVSSSLFHTVIMLYGKCFTDATEAKYPKLEIRDCFELGSQLLKTHEKLMSLRHNLAAHRGSTLDEVMFPYLRIPINSNDVEVKIKYRKRNKPNDDDIILYQSIVSHLIEIVKQNIDKAGNKVYSHIINSLTLTQLGNLQIAGPIKSNV